MIPVSWCRVPSSASWLCCGNAGRQAADLHGCRCLDTRRMRVQVHVPAGHPQDPADYAPPELRNPGKGAEFVTPPIDRGAEIRCYLRDPDGYLIEVGQSTGLLHGKLAAKRPEDLPG